MLTCSREGETGAGGGGGGGGGANEAPGWQVAGASCARFDFLFSIINNPIGKDSRALRNTSRATCVARKKRNSEFKIADKVEIMGHFKNPFLKLLCKYCWV